MTASALLDRLRDLGVTAEARGDRLALRPACAIPGELLAALRTQKLDVLALLIAKDTAPAAAVIAPVPASVVPTGDGLPRVAELAASLAATPGHRIMDPVKAAAYFEAEAARRLAHARLHSCRARSGSDPPRSPDRPCHWVCCQHRCPGPRSCWCRAISSASRPTAFE